MNEDYISFEKVLKELQIEEDELKKLVSAGEIKAFRDADKMRFKREEVEKFKKEKPSGPDVIELLDSDADTEKETAPTLDSSSSEIAEELSFDEEEVESDVGMATAQISEDDFLEEELGEEEADSGVDLGTIELEDEELLGVADEEAGPKDRAVIKKTRIAGVAEEKEEIEPQWALGLMIFSSLILIIGVLTVIDIATSTPSPLVAWLVDIFA